ncbi:hypothetical protein FrCorBMG51_14330 [Protofrankia coriariae]|uniref:Uncharacterized protein n=1 Tax=Protofrankia coriariae TaxID=1562887 RepID=A0ABR5F2J3_9ACTN|nr:hypothetical protein FrCorBMG51_14330 [Protofrankia coriariae]
MSAVGAGFGAVGGGVHSFGSAAGFAAGAGVDGHQWLPHLDRVARLGVPDGQHARERGGHLHQRLGGLHLGDRLVDGDVLTHLHQPSDDLGVGQALTQVGEPELRT